MANRRVPPAVLTAASAAVAALATAGARPGQLVDATLWRERIGADPTQALALGAASMVWLLLAWCAAGLALCGLSAAPGLFGRAAGCLGCRITPALLQRALGLALGAGLAVGVAAPAAQAHGVVLATAMADGGDGGGRALDLPALDLPAPGPPLGRPATVAPPAPPPELAGPRRPARAAVAAAVVVQPGDCLWSLASTALGPGATDAQIAAEWPAWWQANARVIGPDPNLLRPGQRLAPPTS